jgi:hypothetical protein
MMGNKPISETKSLSKGERLREMAQKDFAELFERNSLPEDQRELIIKTWLENIAMRDELRSQGMSNEEITKRMMEYHKMQREQLGGLIGNELAQSWADYYSTMSQRKLATDLTQQFGRIGSRITWAQKDQLVDIFFNNNVHYLPETLPKSATLKGHINTAFTSAQEQVMREAEKVLNPQQMAVMRQYWSGIINQTQ